MTDEQYSKDYELAVRCSAIADYELQQARKAASVRGYTKSVLECLVFTVGLATILSLLGRILFPAYF